MLCVEIQNLATLNLILFGLKKYRSLILERLGTSYGGWYVPSKFSELNTFDKFLISAGIGHDVSFDIEMQKKNFYVVAIDPLQECCDFAKKSKLNQSRTKIINAGLWLNSSGARFHAPKQANHDSWSITNSQNTSSKMTKQFPTITLDEILQEITGDSIQKIIMLKMDIEGAELHLFKDILKNFQKIDFVAIELDYIHLLPFVKLITRLKLILETRKILRNMKSKGFLLVKNEGFNFFWVNEMFLAKLKNENLV